MPAPKKQRRTLKTKPYKVPRNINTVAKAKYGSMTKRAPIKTIRKLNTRIYA